MKKYIKENIRLAIIIVISMIIGSVFTMFIKENNNSKLYNFINNYHSEFKKYNPKLIWTIIESSIKLIGISSLIFKEIEILKIKKEDDNCYSFITKYKDILMHGETKIINNLFISICTYNENFEINYY